MAFKVGYFSNNITVNPLMATWSKLFLPYCDGGSQVGNLETPVSVNGKTIYYRGHRILDAMQGNLSKGVMSEATEVVVSGCSAGGLSTYLHADSWSAAFPSARVTALPDSGFFLDYNMSDGSRTPYATMMRWVASAMNGSLPTACVAQNAADTAQCIFAEHVSKTLKTPTFPIQASFDSWQIANDLGVASSDSSAINNWGQMISERLLANLLVQPQHGIALDSCYHHCGEEWNTLKFGTFTQATAHQAWYTNGASSQRIYNQSMSYPCSSCCV
jgi:hypothetical protein